MLFNPFIFVLGVVSSGALVRCAQGPDDVLVAGIEALGGLDNISRIQTVTYVGERWDFRVNR